VALVDASADLYARVARLAHEIDRGLTGQPARRLLDRLEALALIDGMSGTLVAMSACFIQTEPPH